MNKFQLSTSFGTVTLLCTIDTEFEVYDSIGALLGIFDSYEFEYWDNTDELIMAECVEELIEEQYLELPYRDSMYYAAA